MKIHRIDARDLPDLWFQAVHDILDQGSRFRIDRGSYAGQTRLEYDYFVGHVKYPGTLPLIPDIPPSCGIPNPVEAAYIFGGEGYNRSYVEYLMTGHKDLENPIPMVSD
jgi:thymidylate synthase